MPRLFAAPALGLLLGCTAPQFARETLAAPTAEQVASELQSVERQLYPCPADDICVHAQIRPISNLTCRPAREAGQVRCDFVVYFSEHGGRRLTCSFPLRRNEDGWTMARIDLNVACPATPVGS